MPAGTRTATDFGAVFTALKEMLARYADRLHVHTDQPDEYCLVTVSKNRRGVRMYFGAVRMGKSYVSYHLIPVYSCPQVARLITHGLKTRMQGKSCFNFTSVDPALFGELALITEAGFRAYESQGML
jgi:hypothetical protein